MAPNLPTSQIFKGHSYELKYRAYRFCLNKKQANLLLYFGVIFSKLEKIITYLKFARIQKSFHSECIKNTTAEFTLDRSFSALQRLGCVGSFSRTAAGNRAYAETHSFFLLLHVFLWCSFKNITWFHTINERNQNNSGAKALRVLIIWRSKMQLSVTSPDCKNKFC